MPSHRHKATKEAFFLVPETCPEVDSALQEAANRIKHQTEALREALIEALERAISAEEKIEDLEWELKTLRDRE